MDYEIIYSKRKTLSLQVMPDLRVVVRAPYRLSKRYIDDFVTLRAQWINDRLDAHRQNPLNPYKLSKDEINDLKKRTLEIVVPKVEFYSKIMEVQPNKVSVSAAKRLFGSCNSKGNLNFSFRLALYPTQAIDYVIVHELAHLTEMNHSPRFWAIVGKYMPDYKERKKLLK